MAKGRRYRVVRASRPSRMGRVWCPVDVGRSTYRDIRPRGSLAPRLGLLWSAVRAVTTKIPGCRGYAVLVALLRHSKDTRVLSVGCSSMGASRNRAVVSSCENIEYIKTRLARLFSPCTSKYLRRYQSKRPVENAFAFCDVSKETDSAWSGTGIRTLTGLRTRWPPTWCLRLSARARATRPPCVSPRARAPRPSPSALPSSSSRRSPASASTPCRSPRASPTPSRTTTSA